MQLADLRLTVRPRHPYEAVDLGIRLVQSEARLLWRTWFLVALPVLLLTLVLTVLLHDSLPLFLLWWLKPLYDFALLLVISRRVFGDTLAPGETLRLLAGTWRHGLIGHLTWRRFSMSRSYLLPVWLLENLPRRERQARITLLRNQYTTRARWLHTVMVHLEGFLFLTVLSLLFWFAPEGQADNLWQLFTADSDNLFVLITSVLGYFVAMSVVEPFYLVAGFTLYLNRRTELEAWDLELTFRHLRERLEAHRRVA